MWKQWIRLEMECVLIFFQMTSFWMIVTWSSKTTPSSMLTSWKSMASPSFKSVFWASVLVLAWLRFDLRTGVRTRSPAAFFFLTWKRILESNWKMVEKVEFRSLKVARETYHESKIRSIQGPWIRGVQIICQLKVKIQL